MQKHRFVDGDNAGAGRDGSMKALEGPPNAEKREFVDQKAAARFERVRGQVLAQPGLFAAQGAVVAAWRAYGGRRLGPYFRLAFREGGRQRSIYLGRCGELARRVRCLLARLQQPRRERRVSRRLKAQVRASLRAWKSRLAEALAPWGIQLKGFEFRGSRRALARYVETACGAAWLLQGDGAKKGRYRHSARQNGIGDALDDAFCAQVRWPPTRG